MEVKQLCCRRYRPKRWARHKARKEADARFDQAHEAWRYWAEPHARFLETERAHLEARVEKLSQAQEKHDDFIARHPDVLPRIRELDRDIKEREELERQRAWQRVFERERGHQVYRGLGHDHDLGADLGHRPLSARRTCAPRRCRRAGGDQLPLAGEL